MTEVAFPSDDGVEQVELTHPLQAVREAGADAELRSPEARLAARAPAS